VRAEICKRSDRSFRVSNLVGFQWMSSDWRSMVLTFQKGSMSKERLRRSRGVQKRADASSHPRLNFDGQRFKLRLAFSIVILKYGSPASANLLLS